MEKCVWWVSLDGNNWPGKKVPVKCRSHAVTLHISDIKIRQKTSDIKRYETSTDIKHQKTSHIKRYKAPKDIAHQNTLNMNWH